MKRAALTPHARHVGVVILRVRTVTAPALAVAGGGDVLDAQLLRREEAVELVLALELGLEGLSKYDHFLWLLANLSFLSGSLFHQEI